MAIVFVAGSVSFAMGLVGLAGPLVPLGYGTSTSHFTLDFVAGLIFSCAELMDSSSLEQNVASTATKAKSTAPIEEECASYYFSERKPNTNSHLKVLFSA